MKELGSEAFRQQMQENTAYIEEILQKVLPKEKSLQKTVFQAMEYSVMAGGKRLRPMLLQESYKLFGGTEKETVGFFMAALEMIHTYSLVHDDLPAMDNDDFRRGKMTTHKVYGEDMGILAGDALLNYAYEIALQGVEQAADTKNAVKALRILAGKAGIYGMVGGQVVDVELTGKVTSEEQLDFIYHLKTGALLEASLMVGAVLAGADDISVNKMEEIGRNIGMAFQIQDDILDVEGTSEELGKLVGSDAKNEKRTYVSIYGIGKAKQSVAYFSDRALGCLGSLSAESAFLNTLIKELISRKK
ncbi:MAG: polyprenyl synthetase family protein [Lachnospiraceae bacterium]|jgi:geranylgeranyl diphosphate synthase type II|nr:polyprenyl synthetase family protein [Lachnospiraceae bacterium]